MKSSFDYTIVHNNDEEDIADAVNASTTKEESIASKHNENVSGHLLIVVTKALCIAVLLSLVVFMPSCPHRNNNVRHLWHMPPPPDASHSDHYAFTGAYPTPPQFPPVGVDGRPLPLPMGPDGRPLPHPHPHSHPLPPPHHPHMMIMMMEPAQREQSQQQLRGMHHPCHKMMMMKSHPHPRHTTPSEWIQSIKLWWYGVSSTSSKMNMNMMTNIKDDVAREDFETSVSENEIEDDSDSSDSSSNDSSSIDSSSSDSSYSDSSSSDSIDSSSTDLSSIDSSEEQDEENDDRNSNGDDNNKDDDSDEDDDNINEDDNSKNDDNSSDDANNKDDDKGNNDDDNSDDDEDGSDDGTASESSSIKKIDNSSKKVYAVATVMREDFEEYAVDSSFPARITSTMVKNDDNN